MKIPKIEYSVYCKLSKGKLEKLNLSICENDKILLTVPVIITENLDKLNSSSDYFNDICYTTTSESGTDISLKDRKNEFINENKTVCQDDCDFTDYNYTTQKAKCSCNVKESASSIFNMNIDKSKLFKNFADIKNNFANIGILGCYQNLFTKNNIIKNIGFFIMALLILLHIIFIIIFYCNKINILKNKIKDIIFAIKEYESNNLDKKEQLTFNKTNKQNMIVTDNNDNKGKNILNIKSSITKKEIKPRNKLAKKQNNIMNINIKNNNLPLKSKANRIDKRNIAKMNFKKNNNDKNKSNIIKNKKIKNKIKMNNDKNKNNKAKNISKKNISNNIMNIDKNKKSLLTQRNIVKNNINTQTKTQNKNINNILKYKDNELNSLPYELALQYDKRTYCKYYSSLLKEKHLIIFSFCNTNDYNSNIIKIDLFFIGFCIFYTVNALFYNDDTMHNIYKNKGAFDIEYQLPKIIYSSFISLFFNKILNFLALSNDDIINLKKNKNKNDIDERGSCLKNKLRIKFIFYFILSFIFLILFWYYLSMFGTIYHNTQFHLLKDTLISFGLSFIYPFVINLLPGFFRISALSKKSKYLYIFSKLLQIL